MKRDPWPFLIFLTLLIALSIVGCLMVRRVSGGSDPKALTDTAWVTLAWDNPVVWWPRTGLESSLDLTNWTVITNLTARTGTTTVTLSNRPPREFYRAFNSL